MTALQENPCVRSETTCALALGAVPESEMAAIQAHIASCPDCSGELKNLRAVVEQFVCWPADVLRPDASLQARLARRIAAESGLPQVQPPARGWSEPEWEEAAPGVEYKLLATDAEAHRVSMLVRLAPGANYPPHTHAGAEELHLLDGELWIDDRKLSPGDYHCALPGTSDHRVWSDTGCACVLVTSTRDLLN